MNKAEDGDDSTTNNSVIRYNILNSPSYANVFDVNPVSGELIITKELDYETIISYNETACMNIEVMARDLGIPSLNSSDTISVCIQDVNDVPPKFLSALYNGSVLENSRESKLSSMIINTND